MIHRGGNMNVKVVQALDKSNSVAIVSRPEGLQFIGRYNLRKMIFGLAALLERTRYYDDTYSSVDLFTLDSVRGGPFVALYVTPTAGDDDEHPEPDGVAICALYNETFPRSEVYHSDDEV